MTKIHDYDNSCLARQLVATLGFASPLAWVVGICFLLWFFREEWFVFLPSFCFMFGASPPKLLENSLHVRFSVWVRCSFLGFWSTSFLLFPFFKRFRPGSNRTPPHRVLFGRLLFSFLSRHSWFIAHFGRASFPLAFFSGCHSGPCAFLGFSWNIRGLSSLAPS